jgi:hypothetical protein
MSVAAEDTSARILFVALVNNVGCERIIIEMAGHGAQCALMSPPNYYCTKVRPLIRYFALPNFASVWLVSLFVRRRLAAAVRNWCPTFIVPLDDISAWLLRGLATAPMTTNVVRDLLVKSLGSPQGYRAATHRNLLMEVAAQIGVRKPLHLPATKTTRKLNIPDDWAYPIFLKTEHSCGGDGVTVVMDKAQLRKELEIKSTKSIKQRLMSWLRVTLRATAGFPESSDDEMIVQSFAPGQPAFRTVSAMNGRVLAGVSFLAEVVHPEPTGASTIIRFIENAEMDQTVAAIVAKLGCSGFVSFDFMLDAKTGHATLIEMNARCVGSGHLGRLYGHDVCNALAAELGTKSEPVLAPTVGPALIALFPKELERDPRSAYLSLPDIFHDIPQEQDDLIETYETRLAAIHPFESSSMKCLIKRSQMHG